MDVSRPKVGRMLWTGRNAVATLSHDRSVRCPSREPILRLHVRVSIPIPAEDQSPELKQEAGQEDDSSVTRAPDKGGSSSDNSSTRPESEGRRLLGENFTFKYEIYSQFTYGGNKVEDGTWYSRQSGDSRRSRSSRRPRPRLLR